MSKRSWVFGMLLAVLALAATCGVGMAGAGDYNQGVFVEDSSANCAISGTVLDENGNWYVLKHGANEARYIVKNYSDGNKTTPFISLPSGLGTWSVTPNADKEGKNYLYYSLESEKGTLYRLPLEQGATNPEHKAFQLDDKDFVFESISIAKDPNQFFLMSPHDANLKVTVGLFSFDGGATPIRTWTCVLPKEWQDTFIPLNNSERGYGIQYEADTDKIWLILTKTYRISIGSGTSQRNMVGWLFEGDASASGALTAYTPQLSGGNFKEFNIGRYARFIVEYDGSSPFNKRVAIQGYDSAIEKPYKDALTEWVDKAGDKKSIDDFFAGAGNGNNGQWNYQIDAQGNLYASFKAYPSGGSTWDASWQRFARFSPTSAASVPEAPASLTEDETFTDATKIVLVASPFVAPSEYQAVGSHWFIYKTSATNSVKAVDADLIKEYVQTGDSNTLSVPAADLPGDGKYEWEMYYNWKETGVGGTRTGVTSTTERASFTVNTNGGDNDDDNVRRSGGGCDVGAGALALGIFSVLSAVILRRKSK